MPAITPINHMVKNVEAPLRDGSRKITMIFEKNKDGFIQKAKYVDPFAGEFLDEMKTKEAFEKNKPAMIDRIKRICDDAKEGALLFADIMGWIK